MFKTIYITSYLWFLYSLLSSFQHASDIRLISDPSTSTSISSSTLPDMLTPCASFLTIPSPPTSLSLLSSTLPNIPTPCASFLTTPIPPTSPPLLSSTHTPFLTHTQPSSLHPPSLFLPVQHSLSISLVSVTSDPSCNYCFVQAGCLTIPPTFGFSPSSPLTCVT